VSKRTFVRGRKAAFLLATGFAMLGSADASAGSSPWSGAYLGFESDFDATSVTYTNSGTPHQNLDGALLGVQAGYDWSFGGLVIGVAGDATFGNLNTVVRDGNYITESGQINALGLLRARVGVPMGNFLPYVTGGVAVTSLEQGEICPDPVAAPYGFCNHGISGDPNYAGSSPGPFDLKQQKTLVGATLGAGFEMTVASGWSLQAQYLHSFFPNTTYVLGPDSDGKPLPPSTAHISMDEGTVAFLKRF